MSLIKVAKLKLSSTQVAKHQELGNLGGVNGFLAQHHNMRMLEAGEKVKETKKKIANLTEAQKQAGHPAKLEAELKEHVANVQHHSAKLREFTNPGGESGQATVSRLMPTKQDRLRNLAAHSDATSVANGAEHGVGGLISKAKDYAMKNPGKVGLGAAAVGAAAYGVHKLNQNNQQRY